MNHENPDRRESRTLNHCVVAELTRCLDVSQYAIRTVSAGQFLHHAGDRLTGLPLVESGAIDVVMLIGQQGHRVASVRFEAGELAMMSALFSERPTAIDLVAAQASTLRWIPIREIEDRLLDSRDLLLWVVRFLAQRLREAQSRERAWLERGVHERVCAVLARAAADFRPQAGGRLLIQATHEELAARCGVSRPKLSQELKALERAGKLRLHRGAIEIVDSSAFAADS